MTTRRLLNFLLPLVALLLSSCAGFRPQAGPQADPPGRYAALTEPIIVIGDTQEHESTGVPLVDNDNALDGYLEVTQRPPEQPLFGRRIMEWVFQAHPEAAFMHLGDVLDLSCKSEAERMRHLFEAAPPRGALLPGNHDGLMFGIYGYNLVGAANDPGARKWNEACRRGTASGHLRHLSQSEAFTKRDFITTYLQALRASGMGQGGLPVPAEKGDQRISWRNPKPGAYIEAIEARLIDGDLYADSYIAQRLRLPAAPGASRGVVVIALDTNQAGALTGTWDVIRGHSPGSIGHVRTDQIRAISTWINQAARDGDIVVFAGHHNWQSLGLGSRTLLRTLMSALPHPLVYLSAHTHRGFWAVHRALDRRPLLELNTSSLSDWPIAYRRISFAYDERANRLMVRGDLMPMGPRAHQNDADLLAAWEQQTCAAAGFDLGTLRELDAALLERQRASRGSLIGLLQARLMPGCESCEVDRYRRASEYQNEMLQLLLQTGRDLGADAAPLSQLALPAFCLGQPWQTCATEQMTAKGDDGPEVMAQYRRKAELVDLLGRGLDDLKARRAKAYMTCRAVIAARLDLDGSAESANSHRAEANRISEQFFRTEATVGID